jgi:hypothetical protein
MDTGPDALPVVPLTEQRAIEIRVYGSRWVEAGLPVETGVPA